MILNSNTPIEQYKIGDKTIHVKREDLCTPSPGPTFSKVRGLLKRLQTLKSQGVETVGYTESSVSMAGWGVAWLAPQVGLKAVVYDPQYLTNQKKKPEHLDVLDFHRGKWKLLNAEVVPVQARRIKINYYICKKDLVERYPNSVMLPLGLPFQETIDETAKIAAEYNNEFKTIVICIGSGTICAGVIKGMPTASLYGIMISSRKAENIRKTVLAKAQIVEGGLLGTKTDFHCINPGWEYTTPSKIDAPFPCHKYYDLKAWEWLTKNTDQLEPPILFWNIGS